MQKIVSNLWFDTEAEDAAESHISLSEDSRIISKTHHSTACAR